VRVHRRRPCLTIIDQIDSLYHEAGGDPFMATGIMRSTQDTRSPTAPAAGVAVPTTTRSHSGSGETVRERERGGCCLLVTLNRRWSKTGRGGEGARPALVQAAVATEAAGWHQADDEELELKRRSANNEKETGG
jgi:hypothetical protein